MAKTKLKCENCGNEFERYESYIKACVKKGFHPNFCSKKCQLEFQHKQIQYQTFTCLNCGKEFQRTKREVKNILRQGSEVKFCCKKCKSDYWGRNRVEVVCEVCGKKFLRQLEDVNNHNYCSIECYEKYKETLFTNLICKNCHKEFKVEKSYIISQKNRNQNINFCSKECQTQYQARNMIEVTCDYCGKVYKKNKNYIGEMHFCSLKCRNAYRTIKKEKYAEIANYLRTSTRYKNWRKEVLKRDYYKCTKCNSKKELQVHHKITLYSIVEKYSFNIKDIMNSPEFNDIENGITLCRECHIKEHNYFF